MKNKNKNKNNSGGVLTDLSTWSNGANVVNTVSSLMHKSVDNVLEVGKTLYEAKKEAKVLDALSDYNMMFVGAKDKKQLPTTIPFSSNVGNKFIEIYRDDNINKYKEYCPSAWNSLYELKGLPETTWKKLIESGLNYASTAKEIKNMVGKVKTAVKKSNDEKKNGAKNTTPSNNNPKTNTGTSDMKSDNVPTNDEMKGKTTSVNEDKETTDEEIEDFYGSSSNNCARFNGNVVEINFNADDVKSFNSDAQSLDTLNAMIADIKAYAEDVVKKSKMSEVITVSDKELSLSDLGITEEFGTSPNAEMKKAS